MSIRFLPSAVFLAVTSLILIRCANPVTPEGGPKDVKPPQIIECIPANASAGFKGSSIRIDFDEFINLKNPTSEILISPPLKELPDFRLRGKSLIIKLADSLRPNTTYTINFGKAINDITENNVLTGWTYVFSTGDYVDSLSLRGKVLNAFDLKAQKEVFALLYMNNNDTIPFDSLPLKVAPYYIIKANENGDFLFTNLQQADYKLMAINDQNNDYIYNQPSEKIAFLDSLVKPLYIPPPTPPDSTKKDTTGTLKQDTLKPVVPAGPSYELHLFEEQDSIQRIIKKTVIRDGMVFFSFKYPLKKPELQPLNPDSVSPWCIEEISTKHDSLTLWLLNSTKDSLILRITDQDKLVDTARLDLKIKIPKRKSEKKENEHEPLGIKMISGSSQFNQFKSRFCLEFSYPLSRWDFSGIKLVDGKDTLIPQVVFCDSIKRKIVINYKWKEEKPYTVIIPDSSFFGINQLANDSLVQSFKTRAIKEFGSLILTLDIDQHPGNYIIQLLTEKETLLEEQFLNKSGKVKFEYITPGKFLIKIILDRNKNQRWDTGSYRNKIQPEEVRYFSKTIEIRANWDVEENWSL